MLDTLNLAIDVSPALQYCRKRHMFPGKYSTYLLTIRIQALFRRTIYNQRSRSNLIGARRITALVANDKAIHRILLVATTAERRGTINVALNETSPGPSLMAVLVKLQQHTPGVHGTGRSTGPLHRFHPACATFKVQGANAVFLDALDTRGKGHLWLRCHSHHHWVQRSSDGSWSWSFRCRASRCRCFGWTWGCGSNRRRQCRWSVRGRNFCRRKA
jgi:hypothetical protein